jgi:hypothetical protein
VLDYDALNLVKSATHTSPNPAEEAQQPGPAKKKRTGRKGGKGGKGKARGGTGTPRKEVRANVLRISSPGTALQEAPSDSDLQSDFVIEEIQPRGNKQ